MSGLSSSITVPEGLKDALIGRFLQSLEPGKAAKAEIDNSNANPPFLSIITRTQGLRPDTLRDVFLCLSGQSCVDFEHLVIGHKLSEDTEEAVLGLIEENPDWLRQRIRFLKVDHGNRTIPLNFALDAASGQYAAILDDDDLVLGHWVETFRNLAAIRTGEVLRSVAVYQKFDQVHTGFGSPAPCANGEILRLYPSRFDLFSHFQENRTPLFALAFPRAAFKDLRMRFDESLTTSEDWDYLMRVATVCGVASSPEITGIYRHWGNRSASRTDHSDQEWLENQRHIQEKHNSLCMLLAEGSAERLREILDERDVLARAVRFLGNTGPAARYDREFGVAANIARRILDDGNPELLDELRVELQGLYDSVWWRLSAPVRWVSALTGRKRFDRPEPHDLTEAHLRMAITNVLNSTSWRITKPLRSFGRYRQQRQ
ncbi:MAG: putative O-antigen methyl transferase [Rhodospirillales bacterium]|nr:putative O-antigen methyl transferase [Rhodospirillales bacterium]